VGINRPKWTFVRAVTEPPKSADLGLRAPIAYRAVFEFFPSGVVIADSRGQIQGANLAAKRMLGDLLERERVRCCDLLDCRRAGTPLADHCITDLALSHEGPLPELRVDVPTGGGTANSVWVSASPYGGTEPSVILQLRAGALGDRRRRTEPHWMGGPQLRIFTFGRSRVESGEGPLAGEWLGHRPGHVLKYLVTHRDRMIPTEELIETFWPKTGAATTSVRQAVHTLRDRLEPDRLKHATSAFISSRPGGYELERSAVWIDADDFETCVREGLRVLAAGDAETAEATLSRATGLYRGDFLAEEIYAEWAFSERDRMRDLAAKALRALAQIKIDLDDLDGATDQLHRLAEIEPLDTDIQRDLLVVLMRRGRHAEAARRYELLSRRYRKAFGEDPPFVLSELSRFTQSV
jgi:DNA-binding SARP family transcriptional activator